MQPLSIDDFTNDEISQQQVDDYLEADDDERADALVKAIDKLNPEEQALIAYYYYDQIKMSEIGYIMDMEAGAVATRLHRIRKKLYKIVKSEGK